MSTVLGWTPALGDYTHVPANMPPTRTLRVRHGGVSQECPHPNRHTPPSSSCWDLLHSTASSVTSCGLPQPCNQCQPPPLPVASDTLQVTYPHHSLPVVSVPLPSQFFPARFSWSNNSNIDRFFLAEHRPLPLSFQSGLDSGFVLNLIIWSRS